jgi:hypothetical protein
VRELDEWEAALCFTLYRQRCFGKGHMLIDNLVDGFPRHARGDVKAAVARLRRDGIVGVKATRRGKAVFIPARERLHVYEKIRAHPKFAWLPK